MIYSKTCEYAIRALIYFAAHPEAVSATVKDVSKDSGVSAAYVAKIFQCLAQARILRAQRGPHGGYSLLIPPVELTLLKIVQALDDFSKSSFSNCIMGFDKCADVNPCPLHEDWKRAKEKMLARLNASTIADMAKLGRHFRPGKHRRMMLSKSMRNIFSL